MMLMANHLPAVLDQLGRNAMNREEACPRCDGIGSVTEGETRRECPMCLGVGSVRVPGDPHARRPFAEIVGLIGPIGPPVLNECTGMLVSNCGNTLHHPTTKCAHSAQRSLSMARRSLRVEQ
jgi:hypothetical protein